MISVIKNKFLEFKLYHVFFLKTYNMFTYSNIKITSYYKKIIVKAYITPNLEIIIPKNFNLLLSFKSFNNKLNLNKNIFFKPLVKLDDTNIDFKINKKSLIYLFFNCKNIFLKGLGLNNSIYTGFNDIIGKQHHQYLKQVGLNGLIGHFYLNKKKINVTALIKMPLLIDI